MDIIQRHVCKKSFYDSTNYCPYCGNLVKRAGGKGYAITGMIMSIASCVYTITAYIYGFVMAIFSNLIYYNNPYNSPFDFKGFFSETMLLTVIISAVFAIIFSLLAIIFGAVSSSKGCRSKMKNVAFILGIISFVLLIILLLAIMS